MKKKSLKGSIVLVCLTGVYLYLQDKPTIQLNEIVLQNIEALAQGEGDPGYFYCTGTGDIDCIGYKVYEKITGFSLKP